MLLLTVSTEGSGVVILQHAGIASNKRGLHGMLELCKVSKTFRRD